MKIVKIVTSFSLHLHHLFSNTTNRCHNTNYISTITTKSKSKTHYLYDSLQKINSIFFSNTMSTSVYPTINLDNFYTNTTCSKQNSYFWGTPYKFNSKELDAETGLYYYGARYYNPTLSIWASVDPLSDKYPSLSPYNYCALNPVVFIDPDGMDIDPTCPGYEAATLAATPGSNTYQPAFAELYNKWKEDPKINVEFINNIQESGQSNADGTVSLGGEIANNDGRKQQIYQVYWEPSAEKMLGTSPMFEEGKHLQDALDGKFSLSGPNYINTQNEVEAKQWVVNNIKGIKDKYIDSIDNNLEKTTHYSRIGKNINNPAMIIKELRNGATGVGRSKNEMNGRNYKVYGFGGYK